MKALTAVGVSSQTGFVNPGWGRAHHMRSLPEMQPGIKLPARVRWADVG